MISSIMILADLQGNNAEAASIRILSQVRVNKPPSRPVDVAVDVDVVFLSFAFNFDSNVVLGYLGTISGRTLLPNREATASIEFRAQRPSFYAVSAICSMQAHVTFILSVNTACTLFTIHRYRFQLELIGPPLPFFFFEDRRTSPCCMEHISVQETNI